MFETIAVPYWWLVLGCASVSLYMLADIIGILTRRRKPKPQKAQNPPPTGGQNLELYHRTKQINDENRRLSRNVDLWRRLCLRAREERDEARTELEASKSAPDSKHWSVYTSWKPAGVDGWTNGEVMNVPIKFTDEPSHGYKVGERVYCPQDGERGVVAHADNSQVTISWDDGKAYDYTCADLLNIVRPEPSHGYKDGCGTIDPVDIVEADQTFKVGDSVYSSTYGRGKVEDSDDRYLVIRFGHLLHVYPHADAPEWLTHC